MRNLKVALVHDYLKEYGGAERVLEALHELYPEAPVFTSVYIPEFLGPHRERFKDWDIRTSWLQYIPFKHKLISPFRLLSPWVFGQFDLSSFDIVIVSATGAYFPNMIRSKKQEAGSTEKTIVIARSEATKQSHAEQGIASPNDVGLAMTGAMHICYCHTPPRYLYGYATAREWRKHKLFAILGATANHFLRMVDLQASQNVDFYIANSEEVASRIKKFYRRDSVVVYPPIEVRIKNQESRIKNKKNEYFLTGGRLARAKHIDLIVQACQELGVPLKVFGKGFAGYEKEIKNEKLKMKNDSKKSHIEFLGEVTDEEKYELMRHAKAFLFASEDEDFGITPVEAMSCGIAVIAHKSGGVRETVVEGKTGIFFEELTVASLMQAIQRFEKLKFDRKACKRQAEKFSKERFLKEIKDLVSSKFKMQNAKLSIRRAQALSLSKDS